MFARDIFFASFVSGNHICMERVPPPLHTAAEENSMQQQQRQRGSCKACLWDSVASAWVDLYHAAFVSRQALARENIVNFDFYRDVRVNR